MESVARKGTAGDMVREDPGDVPAVHALDWNFYRFILAAKADPEFSARIRDIAGNPKTKVFHRTVLVRGFGWDATTQTLLESFQPYGPIEDCRVAAAPPGVAADAPPGGVGLVIFKTRAATIASLKQPSKLINNRPAHAQLMFPGVPFFSMTHPAYTPVYLTNISPGTTPSGLYDLLSKLPGEIVYPPFFIDVPAASAFLIYKTPQDADMAIRAMLLGPHIHCSASPRALVEEGTKWLLSRVDALRETDGSRAFARGFEIFLKDINGPVPDDVIVPFFTQFGELLAGPFRYHIDTTPGNEPWALTLFIYKTLQDAENALQDRYITLQGDRLYCSASLQYHVEASLMLFVDSTLDHVVSDQERRARNAPVSPMPSTTLLASSGAAGSKCARLPHASHHRSRQDNDDRRLRRGSTISSSISYGSYTTLEKISPKKGYRDDEVVTPVRRSSRIRSTVTSPSVEV